MDHTHRGKYKNVYMYIISIYSVHLYVIYTIYVYAKSIYLHIYVYTYKTVETVSDFIFLGSKITADGDCSHEIKRRLLLGRKVVTNLDSIFKSRDITLPTKVHLGSSVQFSSVAQSCPTVCNPRLWFFQGSCVDVRVGL